jgi:N-carbamoylputrescine amidase
MDVCLAAIQMYAAPYAVAANLGRARALVEAAAGQGADLVVLPELFNTGYSYSPAMFDYAEPIDGVTAAWLREGARQLGCYLAGGILERHSGDAFSTMILAAPDGDIAAYRKRHPFFWERGLCRSGEALHVAHTALGRIGMLLGADIAYDDANAYAGQVDLLILGSTAALLPDGTVTLQDGRSMSMGRFNPAFAGRAAQMRYDYYEGVGRRAAALGVPVVHAVQCGTFVSPLPAERMGLLQMLRRHPRQLGMHLRRGVSTVRAAFLGRSAVFAADGSVLAVQPDDEGVVFARCPVKPRL